MCPEMGEYPSPLVEYPITILGGIEDLITCASDADPTQPATVTRCTPALPDGCVVTQAYLIALCRTIEDDSTAANYVGTAGLVQVKKVVGGAWAAGIAIPAGAWDVGASAKGAGFAIIGETDVKAQVADGSQVQFRIATVRAHGSNILLHDIQFGLKIYYRM